MMSGFGLFIVYPYSKVDSELIWGMTYEVLIKLGFDNNIKASNYDKTNLTLGLISKTVKNVKHFNVNLDGLSIQLATLGGMNFTILYINDYSGKYILELERLIDNFSSKIIFSQAWIVDLDYDEWQNTISIDSYRYANKPFNHLPTKSNGLPFPVEEEIIDISLNPGRRIFNESYVEAVGSKMWFNDSFWKIINVNKNIILNEFSDNCEIFDNNLMFLKFSDDPFNENSDVDLQNKIRKIIYYSQKE